MYAKTLCEVKNFFFYFWQPLEIPNRLNLLISKCFRGLINSAGDYKQIRCRYLFLIHRALGNSSC